MKTVEQIARQYRMSPASVVRALSELGCPDARADTVIADATLTRFEAAVDDRGPDRPVRSQGERAPEAALPLRRRPPHAIRVAHAFLLPGEPGPAHAVDATGTAEGDPWRNEPADGARHRYPGPGPLAACGAPVQLLLGELFGSGRQDACPECVELVATGDAYRNPPGFRYHCESHRRAVVEGRVVIEPCRFRDRHDGPHESRSGAIWSDGP